MRILSAGWLGLLILPLLAACSSRGIEADTASRLRVAAVAERAGQMDVALSLYRAAAEREPDRAEVQLRYARALRGQGQITQAGEVLATALERHATEPSLLEERGRTELVSGAAQRALTTFEQVLKRQPHAIAALNGRGVALDMLGRHAEARQSYQMALDIDSNNAAASNNLAVSLLLDGQAVVAETVLERLNQGTTTTRIRHNLGLAHAATGDLAGAQRMFSEQVDHQTLQRYVALLAARPLEQ
jgi:Flp pilus assembly protein TadD